MLGLGGFFSKQPSDNPAPSDPAAVTPAPEPITPTDAVPQETFSVEGIESAPEIPAAEETAAAQDFFDDAPPAPITTADELPPAEVPPLRVPVEEPPAPAVKEDSSLATFSFDVEKPYAPAAEEISPIDPTFSPETVIQIQEKLNQELADEEATLKKAEAAKSSLESQLAKEKAERAELDAEIKETAEDIAEIEDVIETNQQHIEEKRQQAETVISELKKRPAAIKPQEEEEEEEEEEAVADEPKPETDVPEEPTPAE